MKCKDCGRSPFVSTTLRVSVCDDCMALRERLLKAVEVGSVPMDQFRDWQRAATNGSGNAAYKARTLLGEVPV